MPSKLLGPDFEDFTITSENLRWFHVCRWEASHAEEYARVRTRVSHSLGKAPGFIKSKTKPSPSRKAEWLLLDENDRPLAWAELQSYPTANYQAGILLWGAIEEGAFIPKSLTTLLSFCFLVGKFDHMKLASQTLYEQEILHAYVAHVGELRDTYVLSQAAWYPGGPAFIPVKTYEVGRDEWVNSPFPKEDAKSLQYIAARVARFEQMQRLSRPKRKRRSLLARLFRPRIDDSIF